MSFVSTVFSNGIKFECPRCEFLLNSTAHIPIVAPCGHTFCDKCIQEDFYQRKKFRCDLCGAESKIHYSKYPTNKYILNIRRLKIKKEDIFVGGKTTIIKIDESSTKSYSFNVKYKIKKLYSKYKIINAVTYTFKNNKFEIITREVDLKKKLDNEDAKTNYSTDIDRKNTISYRALNKMNLKEETKRKKSGASSSPPIEKTLNEVKPENRMIMLDFYGDEESNKQKYSSLYNYFELMKKIFKLGDKYNKKFMNNYFLFIARFLIFCLLLTVNIYMIKYIDIGFFFLFVSILYEKEDYINQISKKIKMFLALSSFYLLESVVKSLGLKYLINMSSYINNIISGIRTLYNLLVLGNDSTLDFIVLIILNILSNMNLLLS